MDKDVRRCIARRARRIRGFIPHRSRKIYMDYVSTVVEKDMRRCYSERNIIILHRKIVNIEPIYGVYCSVWRRYICFLNILYRRCLDGVMVKDVRRCSAWRTRRIRGFNPYRSRNNYTQQKKKRTTTIFPFRSPFKTKMLIVIKYSSLIKFY